VDWYPWGPEAFAAARQADKPIFLSVGYSTCYWCHVMERQCFENESIAAEMNRRFINIKVDREERPDVDQLYMTAVQVLTHQGGWPMSVFLTPDLRPFYGGTYFPPADQYGRPGFTTLLRAIDDAYRTRGNDVNATGNQVLDILRQLAEPLPPDAPIAIDERWIDSLIERSVADYDAANGGFGPAPKFPRQTLLELLLTYARSDPNRPEPAGVSESALATRQSGALKMALHTLDALARGGIRDQLGGAFHRYSTDPRWVVPHFEIMLYDNAMLAWCYTEAYRQTEALRYAHVARGILDFVLEEMTSPDGAFYTAFDAEIEAREGGSYVWTRQEIESTLGNADDARLFNAVYGVDRGANFADPHHGTGRPEANVLYLPESLDTVAARLGLSLDELRDRLAPMRRKLREVRRQRPQPLLDTKIITSWNALMIRAFAYAGQILQEERYVDAAIRAATFLWQHHRARGGGLYRASRDGAAKVNAFLDDYAFFADALLALRDGSGDDRWKDHAASIATEMIEKFGDDPRGGFYFSSADAPDLIVRQKIGSDNPLPAGNAIAARVLMTLDLPQQTQRTLAVFARQTEHTADSMSAMLQTALAYVRRYGVLRVSAVPGASAEDRPLSPEQLAAGVVTLRADWVSSTQLNLHVAVLSGFHINSHDVGGKGLTATELTVRAAGEQGSVPAVEYPPGELRGFAFADAPLRVYAGEVTIAVRFNEAPAGPITLSLRYQACDDRACFPPVSKQLQVSIP
jgi:uncharacterized protein YyaL (SSP411 family)